MFYRTNYTGTILQHLLIIYNSTGCIVGEEHMVGHQEAKQFLVLSAETETVADEQGHLTSPAGVAVATALAYVVNQTGQ